MLNNFVNFDFFFTKLSGIDPCEKRINIPGGHAWRHGLRTPNEGINQKNLKFWADVTDKICLGRT